jgi:DNA-binding GntR family transcriptional regulator
MQNLQAPTDTQPTHFRTKRELAIGTLREAIQSGRYAPGQQLRQTQLMAELGLGSTPARDAVLELLARGVLVQESHHSVRVAELDLPRLRHVYHVRCLLETEAAQLGTTKLSDAGLAAMKAQLRRMEAGKRAGDVTEAARADLQFRRTLYAAADNPILLDFIDQAWLSFPFSILYGIPGRLAQSIKEHHQILDAVGRRDPIEAGRCLRQHLLGALEVLEDHVTGSNSRPVSNRPVSNRHAGNLKASAGPHSPGRPRTRSAA